MIADLNAGQMIANQLKPASTRSFVLLQAGYMIAHLGCVPDSSEDLRLDDLFGNGGRADHPPFASSLVKFAVQINLVVAVFNNNSNMLPIARL